MNLIHGHLTGMIINAFYEVHNTLGSGFLEQVYQNALYKELVSRGLECECQKEISVFYKDELVGFYRADIIVEGKVILELKAVSKLKEEHECQLVNYLKATGCRVGLLMNFGKTAEYIRRVL